MKRILLVMFVLLFVTLGNISSQKIINKGDKFLNLGLGTTLGPYVGYDIGFKKNLTVGGNLGINFLYDVGIFVTIRGDYHFNEMLALPKNIDFYAGASTGALNHLLFAAQTGIRFNYNDKWDLNAELSTGAFFEKNTGIYLYGKIGVTRRIFLDYK